MGLDENAGILTFGGHSYDFDGRLFTENSDFIVQEIEDDGTILSTERQDSTGPSGEKKDFLTFTLVKEGLSTPEAMRMLARDLHINVRRIGYNGNKDKRAITSQRISIFKLDFERFKIQNQNMFFRDFNYSETGCKIGAIYGNRFTIRVREFAGDDSDLSELSEEVKKGLPNFYGPQRFGSQHLNVEVSKKIFARDFRGAFYSLVLEERKDGRSGGKYREDLRNIFGNFVLNDEEIDIEAARGALDALPGFMYNEKMMLRHLMEYKHDYIGAMRLLPKYFRLMIVQAYQSYMFNLVLSRLVGSIGIDNLPEELPSIGYDLTLGEDRVSDVIREVMASEGIESLESFKVTQIPEASLKTFNRSALIVPENLDIKREGNDIILSFSLKKGSYATILLMKMFPSIYKD